MANYSFLSLWQLDAPPERVWEAIGDPVSYPAWWKYVTSVDEVSVGDSRGVGAVWRYRWTTALPYTFAFDSRVTRSEPPQLLEANATGELEGFGRWELAGEGISTTVRYTWNVRTTKPWMNLVAPLVRPAFAWNHNAIMREGGEGLARWLGVRLVRNESRSLDDAPGWQSAPLVAGFACGAVMAVAARRALRQH